MRVSFRPSQFDTMCWIQASFACWGPDYKLHHRESKDGIILVLSVREWYSALPFVVSFCLDASMSQIRVCLMCLIMVMPTRRPVAGDVKYMTRRICLRPVPVGSFRPPPKTKSWPPIFSAAVSPGQKKRCHYMDPVLGPSVGISHLGGSKNGTRFEAVFTCDVDFGSGYMADVVPPLVPWWDDFLPIASHLVQFR